MKLVVVGGVAAGASVAASSRLQPVTSTAASAAGSTSIASPPFVEIPVRIVVLAVTVVARKCSEAPRRCRAVAAVAQRVAS